MSKTPIVFFGSGPVAAKSLELLLTDFEIVAIVTKPKPSHHRGNFPVIDCAKQHKLPLHTVSNKKDLSDLIATMPFYAEVAVLIDFGIIVGQDVIDFFPKGIVNSHFSLLPEWRGADPITFSILSGQQQTGVSLMLLVKAMDEGPLLSQAPYELSEQTTTPELTDQLIEVSAAQMCLILPKYINGEVLATEQTGTPTYSRKLTKEDGELDFSKPAVQLEREIRGFIDWPKSHTKLADIDVIITSTIVTDNSGTHGKYEINNKQLTIYCGTGSLLVLELKPVGKKAMTIDSFIAGYGSKLT